jgi:DNA-binding phage protein
MNLDELKNELNHQKPPNYSEIARKARVSRTTIYNAQRDPQNSSLKVLCRIFDAMGYELVWSLKKKDDPTI